MVDVCVMTMVGLNRRLRSYSEKIDKSTIQITRRDESELGVDYKILKISTKDGSIMTDERMYAVSKEILMRKIFGHVYTCSNYRRCLN